MKIDLTQIDTTQFMVHEHIVNGEVVSLVQPQHIGCRWDTKNKVFRSSVWDANGELISAGFPKFTNWGENPEVFPLPDTLNGATIVEKVDGSLLIVSKWKGQYILRTRGTIDATKLDNGYELEIFKQKFLPVLDKMMRGQETWPESVLFEWVSPTQKIILSYGDEPDWYLVGSVLHSTYTLAQQYVLDIVAKGQGWKRPVTYNFPSIEDLLANVEQWKGKEGVVIYSPVGLHKAKSIWYLCLHKMKSELSSFDKVIDVWQNLGRPTYQAFYDSVAKQFDFELANQIQGDMSRICDGFKEVGKITDGFNRFITTELLPLGDPRDKKARGMMARKVLGAYGDTNRATFLFKLLDGRPLENDDYKRLIYQVLK